MSSNTTQILPEPRIPYGYVPTEAVCIAFLTLFAVSGLIHTFQAIKYRTWWMIATLTVGCLGECIGWAGRLWSSRNPTLLDPFLMQITTTIISPSFMSAANFTILGFIIRTIGQQHSRLSPRWYLIIFISLDLVSLIVQAIGGARASAAAQNHEDADPGGRIMLYGIVLQMIALTIYCILGAEVLIRYYTNRPVRALPEQHDESVETLDEKKSDGRAALDRNNKLMLLALVITTVFLFIRAIYRTIELNDGWDGSIITNQNLFNWLDGMPITVVTYTFNILHPGYLLFRRRSGADTPAALSKA
ncbi:hypothetical protein FRC17_006262 [Serendipita sp. 399]|nr:hypothetical protein FRC17_006262 [Serendipita sp. 399]